MARLSRPIFVTLTFSAAASFSRNWAKNSITCDNNHRKRRRKGGGGG
jgi:hypothetical protein